MKKRIPDEISCLISSLRFILFLQVLFNHIESTYFMPSKQVEIDFFELIEMFLMNFAIVAVPIYFIISGYLLFKEECSYTDLIKKKIYSLLIPFCLWQCFQMSIYLFGQIIPITRSFFMNSENDILHFSWMKFLCAFWGVGSRFPLPFNGPLWYVRDLFIIVLFFPLLRKILNKAPAIIFVFLFLWKFHISLGIIQSDGLLFVSIGYLVCKYEDKVLYIIDKLSIKLCTLLFTISSLGATYFRLDNDNLLSLCFALLLTISIAKEFTKSEKIYRLVSNLSKHSFFVYGIHSIIVIFLCKIVARVLPNVCTIYISLIVYFGVFFIGVCICYAISHVVYKVAPPVFYLMSGKKGVRK